FDGEFDFNRAGFLENQCPLERLAFLYWLLEAGHHDVKRCGLELDRLTGPDHNTSRNRAHPHDALVLVHAHFMEFKFFGNRRRTANQSVRLASGVRDRDVPGRYGRPLGDRPGPWVIDFKRAKFVVISARTGGESENTSDQDAELLHGTL